MSKYKPAVFQPTVRPDWGGTLSYLNDKEKAQIFEAIIKFPTIDIPDSKFWQETIKPDLEQQYARFVQICEQRRRGVCNRWALHKGIDIYNISNTQEQDKYKTSNRYGILPEEEGEDEGEGKRERLNNSRNDISKLSTTHAQQFNPPTLQQVLDYARMQNGVAGMGGFACTQELAEQFWSHYESIGWRVGNENRTPITNWQSKLRNWAAKDKQAPPPTSKESDKERKARENHEKIQKMLKGEQI